MFERWEIMVGIFSGLLIVLMLANLARIAFGGRKPPQDEHAKHLGI